MRPKAMAVFCAVFLATAASATPVNYSVDQWGKLGLQLPEGWTSHALTPAGSGVKITPGGGEQLVLVMAPVPATGKAEELEAAARKAAETAKLGLAKNAVESELRVRGLSEDSQVFYVSATDGTVKEPSATSLMFIDQGTAVVGRLIVSFTIKTNVKDGGVREQAREIVRSAKQLPPGSPWHTREGGAALSYPRKAWKLALDLPGYEIDPFQLGPDGKGVRLTGRNPATRMVVSVVLAEAHPGWTAVEQREDAWKTMQEGEPIGREDVLRSELGPMAILEMRVPTYWGREVNQKSVFAFLVRDGVRVDVHLSKVAFQDSEKELFDQVLQTVRFVE